MYRKSELIIWSKLEQLDSKIRLAYFMRTIEVGVFLTHKGGKTSLIIEKVKGHYFWLYEFFTIQYIS